jgi:hypothetical protein
MTPSALNEKIRNIKGVEQSEYFPVKSQHAIAFIFRANGGNRFGSIIPLSKSKYRVSINRKTADEVVKTIKEMLK